MGRYRWLILTAGTLSATSLSAVQIGISAITPALRERYGLSLGEIGIVLGATNAGMTLTLLAWGIVSDRIGERLAIVIGLTGSAVSLAVAARVSGFVAPVFADTYRPLDAHHSCLAEVRRDAVVALERRSDDLFLHLAIE